MEQYKAVIGTNSWGSSLYEILLRGNAVNEDVILETIHKANELNLGIFDTAQDYGFGKCQKMLGKFNAKDLVISAKYTPVTKYKENQVHKSFNNDLKDFKREDIDIYWLHLPNDIEENLNEIIDLYNSHKIHYIGISNFNLEECKKAKKILDKANIPLYGVQNHFSLIERKWEEEGVLDWCHKNNISFWGWAVLEEGILTGRSKHGKKGIMDLIMSSKRQKLGWLYDVMEQMARNHECSVAELSVAYCCNKGVIPIVGCRTPKRVESLYKAVEIHLSEYEIELLERTADIVNVTVLGADLFRFSVHK